MPTPRFLIFYNGEQEQPERRIPAAVGCLHGTGGVPGAGTGSGHAEHQRREEPAADGVLPDLIRLCQVHPEGTRLCEGHGDLGGRRAGGDGMHRGRDSSEFLSKNRAEASKVSIYKYDEEKHMRQVERRRPDGWKKRGPKKRGRGLKLITQIQKKCREGEES